MYIIKRSPDGKYVSQPGSQLSYTGSVRLARKFSTKEDAERDRCPENEYVVSLWDEVGI